MNGTDHALNVVVLATISKKEKAFEK